MPNTLEPNAPPATHLLDPDQTPASVAYLQAAAERLVCLQHKADVMVAVIAECALAPLEFELLTAGLKIVQSQAVALASNLGRVAIERANSPAE